MNFSKQEIQTIADCFHEGMADVSLSGNRGAWRDGQWICLGISRGTKRDALAQTIPGDIHVSLIRMATALDHRRPGQSVIVV